MAITYHYQDCNFKLKGKLKCSRWIKQVVESEGGTAGDVAVVFCSDSALLEVNRQYLNHDYLTDIITFDYCENGLVSGDLMISIDTVAQNAKTFDQDGEQELMRVIIHGVLHLLGYGDASEQEKEEMRAREDKYLLLKKMI